MPNLDAFAEEREQTILNLLKERKRITVPELVEIFQISGTTIRRQLKDMDKKGKLIRTHGGAISMEEALYEESLETKFVYQTSEKKAIAKEARKHIHDSDVIALGGGTTILELAKLLHDAKDLIVITNSIPIAAILYSNKNIEVQVCGGTIREKTGVIVGPSSIKFVKELYVAKTFVGADSISIEYGLTTPNTFEAEIEKQLIQRGDIVYVLADSTKMDKITLAKQSPLDDIDYMITDSGTNVDFIEKLKASGVKVIIAQEANLS